MTRQVLMMMSISILNIFYTRCTKVYTLDCLLNQSRIDCPVRVDRGIPFLHLLLLVSCLKHTRFRQMISQSLSSCFLIHSLTIFLSFFLSLNTRNYFLQLTQFSQPTAIVHAPSASVSSLFPFLEKIENTFPIFQHFMAIITIKPLHLGAQWLIHTFFITTQSKIYSLSLKNI